MDPPASWHIQLLSNSLLPSVKFISWLISHPHSVHLEKICLCWSGIGCIKYNLTDVEIPQSLPQGDLFLPWTSPLYPPPKSPFLICFMKPQFPCPTPHPSMKSENKLFKHTNRNTLAEINTRSQIRSSSENRSWGKEGEMMDALCA